MLREFSLGRSYTDTVGRFITRCLARPHPLNSHNFSKISPSFCQTYLLRVHVFEKVLVQDGAVGGDGPAEAAAPG